LLEQFLDRALELRVAPVEHGFGVVLDPDIVVENDAKSVLDGRDPQLERAVEELLKQVAAKPAALPKRAVALVKTK
jgi:tricorn protease